MKDALQKISGQWAHNRTFAIGLIILLASLVRLGSMLVLSTYRFNPQNDHWSFGYEWARIAKWLLERDMFSLDGKVPTAAWDPFYVFVIVPFFQFFGIYTEPASIAILVFQIALSAVLTWVIFVLAETLYGSFEARVASLLFALYPASIYFSIFRVGPTNLIVLLIGLIFLVAIALQRTQRRRFAVLLGVLMGVLILTSSKTQSLIAVIPIWLWFASNGPWRHRLINSSLFVLVAVLTVLPWSVRNGLTTGQFSPSRADFSYHLWRGNNPNATGYWYTSPNAPEGVYDPRTISQEQYRQMAVTWIAANPEQFAQLIMKRIKSFWYKIDEKRRNVKRALSDNIHTWGFMAVLGLSIVGLSWSWGYWNRVSLILLFVAMYPLVFYLTHVTLYRYRFPIEPFLLILASRGLHGLWRLTTKSRSGGEPSANVYFGPAVRDQVSAGD